MSAHHLAALQPGTLIVPLEFKGETNVPEMARPSLLTAENSPFRTDGDGENVKTTELPHDTLTSSLFRTVNRMSISYSGPA